MAKKAGLGASNAFGDEDRTSFSTLCFELVPASQSCDALSRNTEPFSDELHFSSIASSQHISIYRAFTGLKTEHLKKHWGTSHSLAASFVTRTCCLGEDNGDLNLFIQSGERGTEYLNSPLEENILPHL